MDNYLIILLIALVSIAIWLEQGGRSGQNTRNENGWLSGVTAIISTISKIGLLEIAVLLSLKLHWWWIFVVALIYVGSFVLSIIFTIPLGSVAKLFSKSPLETKNNIDLLQIITSVFLFGIGWFYLIPKVIECI